MSSPRGHGTTDRPGGIDLDELLPRDRKNRHVGTGGFTAVLTVDPDGLPIDYENIWQRVAEGPASRGSTPRFESAWAGSW